MTINTTIMKENVGEVPELVKLAKSFKVGISLALVYNYDDISIEQPSSREMSKVADGVIKKI